jgi:hypothetical protein
MEQSERYPSYVASVANALSGSAQPLTIDVLVDKVRGQRPISKGVRSAVYRAIKQLYQAVPVAPGQFGWLSHLLRDSVFRHPLTNDEVRRGFLLLDELEHAVFFPQFFQNHRPDTRLLNVELFGGPTVRAEAAVERRTWSLRIGAPLVDWVEELGGQGRDDLIITARDAVAGEYLVRLQPREVRDEESIRSRNLQVAMAAEELVLESRRTEKGIPTWELAALLIGRGLFTDPLPPDDLHLVLQSHSMLALSDGQAYTVREHNDGAPGTATMRPTYFGGAQRVASSPWEPGSTDDRDRFEDDEEMDERGFGPDLSDDGLRDDESCQDYEEYLEQYEQAGVGRSPLSHNDYHLLEAELETLIGLEQEFGYLLPDQKARVEELADRLFIDPESLRNADQGPPDDDEFDGPTYWQN